MHGAFGLAYGAYWPGPHSTHVPSFAVEPVNPTWSKAERLPNPSPGGQDENPSPAISVHTSKAFVLLYIPAAHREQAPSFNVAPSMAAFEELLLKPSPAMQGVTPILLQAMAPDPVLYSPIAQMVQVPSS